MTFSCHSNNWHDFFPPFFLLWPCNILLRFFCFDCSQLCQLVISLREINIDIQWGYNFNFSLLFSLHRSLTRSFFFHRVGFMWGLKIYVLFFLWTQKGAVIFSPCWEKKTKKFINRWWNFNLWGEFIHF